MALLNHTLKSLAQGVSQQHNEARFETQVEEMINCIPDVSRGIYRRNPLNTLSTIDDASFNAEGDFFTYTYDRGDDEKYSIIINNNKQLKVIDMNDGSTVTTITSDYLSVPTEGIYPKVYNSFVPLTIGDFTFIVNKNTTVTKTATADGTTNSEKEVAIYWIKDVTAIESLIQTEGTTDSSISASNYEGYSYTLNGVTVQAKKTYVWNSTTGTFDVDIDLLKAEDIAAELATQLGSDYAASGSFVYWVGTGQPTTWEWNDSIGGGASFGFNGEIADSAYLPNMIDDTVVDYYDSIDVYITGGTNDNIGYWLTYEQGLGWTEGRKPGMYNTIDSTTMPHVLVRGSDGIFYFKPYESSSLSTVPGLTDTTLGWKPRLVGDTDTAKDPSFIGSTITDIFFYQNRLCFLSGESVIFSTINKYGTFYPTSVRAFVESDSVDISISGKDVKKLYYAIEVANTLLIFSDDTQFMVSSSTGAISQTGTTISIASKYNMLPKASPIVVGDSAYFVSSVGATERLYKYSLSEKIEGKFIATDVSIHVPTYIDNSTYRLLGHSTIGYTFLFEYGSTDVYVYNGTVIGEQSVQSAIHKWVFPLPIIGSSIIDNKLFILLIDKNEVMYGTYLGLGTSVTFDNVVYTDTVGENTIDFTSYVTFSEWQVKENEFGTNRGRLQIRTIMYSLGDNSSYTTELTNNDLQVATYNSLIQSGYWDDTLLWTDVAPWSDTGYKFTRNYTDQELITVMGNSKNTTIRFKESDDEPTKGFNLKTVNYEGFFYQRSRRY